MRVFMTVLLLSEYFIFSLERIMIMMTDIDITDIP